MKPTLDGYISKARSLWDSGEEEEAMLLASEVIENYSEEAKAWSLRAHLHTLAGRYIDANSDLSSAISINPHDPYFFFRRGLNHLQLQNWRAAADDFTTGLRLDDEAYVEAFHFARAEAFIRAGLKDMAQEDLSHVGEHTRMWTSRLRTKRELVQECNQLPG